jgi:hypothetical protein
MRIVFALQRPVRWFTVRPRFRKRLITLISSVGWGGGAPYASVITSFVFVITAMSRWSAMAAGEGEGWQ